MQSQPILVMENPLPYIINRLVQQSTKKQGDVLVFFQVILLYFFYHGKNISNPKKNISNPHFIFYSKIIFSVNYFRVSFYSLLYTTEEKK